MSKISVLMPVYNTKGEYLKEAIESILNQTYTDFEFLIIDDSTNQETLQVLNKYREQDSRIKIIKGEHKGIGAALNKLIDIAQGEYLARMDSDDISFPERFDKQIKYFETHPEISICSSSYITYPKGELICHPEKVSYLKLLSGCFVAHPAVMIKKTSLDRFNLRYDETMKVSEDYDLWSRAIRYLNIANIEEPLLKYRVLENSNFHKNTDIVHISDSKIRQNMLDFLTNDKELQLKITNLVFHEPKYTFWEQIFSVKNQMKNNKKYKVLTTLGIKFKFKKYSKVRIVRLMGGIGNQMFQYAFGKALEIKTGQKVLFDKLSFEELKTSIINNKKENANGVVMRDYALDLFNINSDEFSNLLQIGSCKKTIYEKNAFIYDKKLLKKQKSAYYEGYFQNENYFKDIKEIIKKEFKFPDISAKDEFNQNWLKKINTCENPVFIHLRRGDYVNLGWDLSIDYYKNAIKYIKEHVKNPTFFVFGQDCKEFINKEFSNIDAIFEIIGEENSKNNEDWKDITLMLECKHAIIANSTFSWWGAWLGKANDGIVAAPTPFVNNQDDIICDNWIKIER